MSMGIYDWVVSIIKENLCLPNNKEVARDSDLVEDLGADELDEVEIVMALEEHFGITISDEDSDKLKTVGDYVDIIVERQKE